MVVENLEKSRKKLTFDVTKEEFEKALDKAFLEEVKKVTIPGFRKGKAPRSVFEKNYGVEALFPTALDFIFDEKVSEITKDQELVKDFIGQFEPTLDEKIERGKDFKVSLIIDVYPEVTLGEYKGVEVKKQNLEVSDDEVNKAIESLALKDATKEAKENATIENGDYAIFDFVGTVDGVEFHGGKADNYELKIGSGQFIPGFEDQMVGMKVDEEKDINVTFPENYGEASLAGKAAVFKVKVHEVKSEKFPEFTDEYVKELKIDNVSNLDELKALKKKELADAKAISEKDRQVNDIITSILDNAKVELPKTLIDNRFNSMKSQYEQQAKMYNIPFDTFIQIMGSTKEQFEDILTRNAERQALFDVVAAKIIEDEKLVPTKEQVEAKAEEEATKTKGNKDDILKTGYSRIYNQLSYDLLVEFLLSNAKEI